MFDSSVKENMYEGYGKRDKSITGKIPTTTIILRRQPSSCTQVSCVRRHHLNFD